MSRETLLAAAGDRVELCTSADSRSSCSVPDTSEEATISAIMPDDKKKKVLNTREIREWKPALSSSSSGSQSKRGLNSDWPAHTVGQFTLCCVENEISPMGDCVWTSVSNWYAVMGL